MNSVSANNLSMIIVRQSYLTYKNMIDQNMCFYPLRQSYRIRMTREYYLCTMNAIYFLFFVITFDLLNIRPQS
jgi:hypothetical protein